jgi:hypothetical protein
MIIIEKSDQILPFFVIHRWNPRKHRSLFVLLKNVVSIRRSFRRTYIYNFSSGETNISEYLDQLMIL